MKSIININFFEMLNDYSGWNYSISQNSLDERGTESEYRKWPKYQPADRANHFQWLQRVTRGSKCRQRISKTELQVRNAVQVINKDGQRLTTKKVCDLLTLETSPTTVRRRLKCMGYRYRNLQKVFRLVFC